MRPAHCREYRNNIPAEGRMERDRSDDGIAFTGRAPRVPFPGQDVEPGRAVLALPPDAADAHKGE